MITPAYSPTATERVLPRLALDFTTAALDSRVTVTRALNTATRVNASGLIEIVNANLPRFDYDPATLACKGLLIEEARTNSLLYSEQIDNAVWDKVAAGTGVAPVVSANAGIAPDGTQTADLVVLNRGAGNTGSDQSRISQTVTVTNATAYSGTMYVKAATAGDVGKQVAFRNVAGGNYAIFTLTADWQRISKTETSISTSGSIDLVNRGTYTTGNSVSVLVWGAQLEAGAFATSYIPTTTTSLTRNADVVTMTGTNFSSWYNQSEGGFVAIAQTDRPTSAGSPPRVVTASDGTENNRVALEFVSTNIRAVVSVSGSNQLLATLAYTPNSVTNFGLAYKLNSFAFAKNGEAPTTSSSGTVPSGLNVLQIGSTSASANFLCGRIQKLFFWPQRIINAETQAFCK